MVMDDHEHRTDSAPPARRTLRFLALAAAAVACAGTGFLALRWLHAPDANAGPQDAAANARASARLFQTWPRDRKPDLVLLLTGQVHGYMQPCGCSEPQYGGLERRYNFLQALGKERGWPVVAVDLGDLADRSTPQAKLKYKFSMEAYRRLGYTAVGIGVNETRLPLFDGLAEYALNNPSPRVVAANLLKKDENFPEMVKSWEVSSRGDAPKVGVIGVVAKSVADQVKDDAVKFDAIENVLPGELKNLQARKPEVLVLLCQGTTAEARAVAKQFREFQVVLALTAEEEPPQDPERVGTSFVVNVGHKGRYVGLVGLYRTGKDDPAFEMHYHLVALGPEYKTPPGKDADNPVLAVLEDYAKEVQKGDYLAGYARTKHPIQDQFPDAKYVGSEKCKSCHKESYKVWKASPHSRAYASLETAERPHLRQYDGECVRCHVTGFAYEGGFTDEKKTPHLKDNGCENCHGPGSPHLKDNYDAKLLALMNPYKTKPNETAADKERRINALDASCQKCHDVDNDVHWKIDKWTKGHIFHKESD